MIIFEGLFKLVIIIYNLCKMIYVCAEITTIGKNYFNARA